MTATPTTRTRTSTRRLRVVMGGAAVLAVLTFAGCAQNNTPKAYNTTTQQNFVELCTNFLYTSSGDISTIDSASSASTLDPALKSTDSTIKADTESPNESSCLCMYSVFVDQIPINKSAMPAGYTGPNFTDLNSKMKSDPQAAWDTLPSKTTDALSACQKANGGSTGSTTTSTVVATTTTAATN